MASSVFCHSRPPAYYNNKERRGIRAGEFGEYPMGHLRIATTNILSQPDYRKTIEHCTFTIAHLPDYGQRFSV
ncbi:MAG: hypothetical protein SGI89_11990, partial [bacterium]|nr:hypothetical protein [bacterium]